MDFIIRKPRKFKTHRNNFTNLSFFLKNLKMVMPNNLSPRVIYDGVRVLSCGKIFQRENSLIRFLTNLLHI